MEFISTDIKYQHCKPEVWGGVECTINRINDSFRDQLLYAGHYTRQGDIEQFAALGIKKLRYPVLWEFHQPVENKSIDWTWTSQQLELIKKHDINPIVGLVHHGSGPAYTDLLDEKFPHKLASYASLVSKQFPWIEYYTPVNEPLTTARFSGLYGYWYPHAKNESDFFKMLINQLKGVVLSMQAIRKINPNAKLIQTEDLAKIHSTASLKYQAEFENKRKWLTYDLLCGKVDRKHFFWKYIISKKIKEKDLLFFLENPTPPDIIGFNYYVTSERYLDDKIENYPPAMVGGNGKHQYVDVEAVRVIEPDGLGKLLREAWNRYQLPISITENHLGCTREEQMRWFKEAWEICCELRQDNIDIKAITVWSLLGAYDWNSLLTNDHKFYEPGAFDISTNAIRKTALGKMVNAIATTGKYDHPVLNTKGWWSRCRTSGEAKSMNNKHNQLLIIGRNGTLGTAFMNICNQRSISYTALSRKELDITNEHSIKKIIDEYKPWGIVNTAGYVRVDDAEANNDECFTVNAIAPGLLADVCNKKGIRFMTFSSDLVFDGNKKSPYNETDSVKPLNVYGISKAKGEELVKNANSNSLIIRTSAFFGPWDKYNFAYNIIESLKNGTTCNVVKDVIVSPTYVPDLTNTAMDLFIDEEEGIWHLSNAGMLSWCDFANAIADRMGYKKHHLSFRNLDEMGWKAPRPLYSALKTDKGTGLPSFENALNRYFEEKIV